MSQLHDEKGGTNASSTDSVHSSDPRSDRACGQHSVPVAPYGGLSGDEEACSPHAGESLQGPPPFHEIRRIGYAELDAVCEALHRHALYVRLGDAEPVPCEALSIGEREVTAWVRLLGNREQFDLGPQDRLVIGGRSDG